MEPDRKITPLPAPDRLDSWKEIAAYLNRSERTVRRWEAQEELPVHRLRHDKRGSVYAYARELDAWRASRRLPDEPVEKPTILRATWLRAASAAVLVLIVLAAGFGFWPASDAIEERGTSNDEAWRLFQRAAFAANAGRTQIETGIRYYQEAIQLDPKFARAWAGLASAQMALTFFGEHPASDTMAEARRNAEQARRLDPSQSGPWRVLGWVSHYVDFDHRAAEANFRRAIDLYAKDAVALSWYGDFLLNMRRFDEARASYMRAHNVNPRWLEPSIFAANIHTFTGQPAMAIIDQARTLETEPNYGLGLHFLGRSYLVSGDSDRAIDHLRKSNEVIGSVPFTLGDLGYALAVGGKRDEAERLLEDLRSRRQHGYYPAFPLAEIALGLGNTNAALDWLELAIGERHTGFFLPSVDPKYDRVRNVPRFRDLMRRMNLPAS